MSEPNFPKLQPAMTMMVEIRAAQAVGSASRGTPLNAVPMTGGTAVSHPSFATPIDAVVDGQGNDYIRNDPSGKHMRLDAHAVLKSVLLPSPSSVM
ncbi:MAG: hypothetical protein L6R40_007557 [Gallowayella cf. fulva]|nr:MAG: hypothetical protein L6R40_007557 [Xanthomendoza cf. fulva]